MDKYTNTLHNVMKMIQKNDHSHTRIKDDKNSKNTPNPTLGTIRMVEETLIEMKEYPSKNQLWRKLPRQVQYPIFREILKYLEESNKITVDSKGAIIWIFSNEQRIRKLREKSKKLA